MQVDSGILASPVAQGVRLIALGYLDDAHTAGERLSLAHDADALHDLRVAVRRLRSWFRAFDDELSASVKKKDRRRLRDIAHATGAGRDIDVQLAWLDNASKGFRAKRRRGAEWLADYLKARQRHAGDPVDAALVDDFERGRLSLAEQLSTYAQRTELPHSGRTLAAAIAERVMPHVSELGQRLAALTSVDDETEAHQARIAAKRLRYLIEPAVDSVDNGDEMLDALKALQDSLGALHDAHVMGHQLRHAIGVAADTEGHRETSKALGRTAPDDGLLALAKRARADARAAFGCVRDAWLGDRFPHFSRQMSEFADRLAALHE